MSIEPPGYPGKKTAEAEGQKFVTCRVDSGGPDSHFILPDGMENNADIGIGYLPHDGAQAEHHDGDGVVISDPSLSQSNNP